MKPPSKPKAPRKGAKVPEGSGEAVGGQEGALTGQERPVHSRARANLSDVLDHLRNGTPISHACALSGVPRQSFYDLIAADEDVALEVARARAVGAEEYREELVKIAKGGLPGANANVLLHLMERLYPDDYAPPKQRVETSGPGGGAQKHEVVVTDTVDKLSDDEVIRAAKALLGKGE